MEIQADLSDNMRRLEDELNEVEEFPFYKKNSSWIRTITLIVGI